MRRRALTTSHILEICSKCQFLRLIGDDQFVCSLEADGPKEGANLLLKLSHTHQGLVVLKPQCPGRKDLVNLIAVINELSQKVKATRRGLIGFSTGCLYYYEMALVDKLKVFLRSGATAVELSFGTPQELLEFSLDEPVKSKLRKFHKITIHAPWKKIRYFDGSGRTDPVITKLKELVSSLPITGVVFHPDTIAKFNGLEIVGLPVLIENMDRLKGFGKSVEDFEVLKADYDFGFVLDLQHAFEHDPSMGLAKEMIQVMDERLSHLHVSGEFGDHRHVPLHLAENQQVISQMIKLAPSVPIILEGIFTSPEPLICAKRELAYLIR